MGAVEELIRDMDRSVSPTRGARENSAHNGHLGCNGYDALICFNRFGDLARVVAK